jgi:transaldolase/glucose-6-phosphate isomerase
MYRDVVYVEELIGPDTVNTIPPATFDAFRAHGEPRASLTERLDGARQTMEALADSGVSIKQVTDRLLDEGLQLFAEAFEKLLGAIDKGCRSSAPPCIGRMTVSLPEHLEAALKASLDDWGTGDKVRRLWARDASVWTGKDEGRWLGWLGVADDQLAHLHGLKAIAEEARSGGFSHALLLGMGGSSLCPEVMTRSFGRQAGYPELHILDSTDPAQLRAVEAKIDVARTLFIVSSKSGGTLEPTIFKQYFIERARQVLGVQAADRFIAITDPGSALQRVAEQDRFRHIFHGAPDIGGRYSALSNFGMVPSAIMGVDVGRFLDRAEEMVGACSSTVPVEQNPGVVLGAILGVLAKHGRDKVTLIASPRVSDLGAWLEQLLAESTGKEGRGLIPVDREAPGAPAVYGGDRLFVYVRLASDPDASQDAAVAALERAGHPVVRISMSDAYDLGQEFFRWEIATAVAGSILGINAFDQPDVEASKIATRTLTMEYERTGALPEETPIFEENGIALFADPENAASLHASVGAHRSLVGYLRAHLARLGPGDYFALLAYLEMNDSTDAALQAIRHAVRDRTQVATCLGFGPRFLHSTGQAYKGGPNTGVFLQITCSDAIDVPVPRQHYTFGVVKAAQARGDFQVLAERKRRALRVHLGTDVETAVARVRSAIEER